MGFREHVYEPCPRLLRFLDWGSSTTTSSGSAVGPGRPGLAVWCAIAIEVEACRDAYPDARPTCSRSTTIRGIDHDHDMKDPRSWRDALDRSVKLTDARP